MNSAQLEGFRRMAEAMGINPFPETKGGPGTMEPAEIEAELAQCRSSERHHEDQSGMKYTDGIKAMAELCSAYWLIDLIASAQMARIQRLMGYVHHLDFRAWTLKVKADSAGRRSAVVECWTDTPREKGSYLVYRQAIKYTDFPLDEFRCWVEGGVILLPSEH